MSPEQGIYTAQEMKFPIKDFFSKCEQIRRKVQWKTYFFCSVPNDMLHWLEPIITISKTKSVICRQFLYIFNAHCVEIVQVYLKTP